MLLNGKCEGKYRQVIYAAIWQSQKALARRN